MSTPVVATLVIVPLMAFWLWMLWQMLQNTHVAPNVRPLWIIGFLLAGLPTALYYFFTEYRHDH